MNMIDESSNGDTPLEKLDTILFGGVGDISDDVFNFYNTDCCVSDAIKLLSKKKELAKLIASKEFQTLTLKRLEEYLDEFKSFKKERKLDDNE